jgi:TonB family protein
VAVLILNTKKKGEEPLLIVDGKIATIDQVRALPRESIVKVATMREKTAIKSYGEKAKYGALIITTVKHQEEIDNEPLSQPDVFDKVDEMPHFPDGMAGLMQYLSTNVRYPKDAKESGTQGRVIVSFIVEKDGSISNAKVTKPTYSSLDEEALRVVSAMPKWVPGKQNGEAVRVKYAVPVSFRLKGEDLLSGMSESTSFKDLTNRLPGAEIDENGKIFINGKEVKRLGFDGSENDIGIAIMNIMLKDPDRFDYEVDGEPVTVKDMKEKNASKTNPIKKIEYVAKDSEHPKDRLLITTK